MPVKVITDSTSDLPLEIAQQWDITVIPLNVHFGDDAYKDGIDISREEFYRRLSAEPNLPTTSQPAINDFLQLYTDLISQGNDVISVHLSEKFSGTLNSAWQARRALEDLPESGQSGRGRIEIVDSRLTSMGLGLVTMEIARMVKEGAGLVQLTENLERILEKTNCYVLLETLEYLSRGGRIGKASSFLGSLLSIKPIIMISDGEAHPVERVRTREKGIRKLIEVAEGLAPLRWVSIVHSSTPEEVDQLRRRLSGVVSSDQIIVAGFGPVIGTYVGPGGLGLGLMSDS